MCSGQLSEHWAPCRTLWAFFTDLSSSPRKHPKLHSGSVSYCRISAPSKKCRCFCSPCSCFKPRVFIIFHQVHVPPFLFFASLNYYIIPTIFYFSIKKQYFGKMSKLDLIFSVAQMQKSNSLARPLSCYQIHYLLILSWASSFSFF